MAVEESLVSHDLFRGTQTMVREVMSTPGSNVQFANHHTAPCTLETTNKKGHQSSLFASSLMLTWCEFAMVSSHFCKTVWINTGVGCSCLCFHFEE